MLLAHATPERLPLRYPISWGMVAVAHLGHQLDIKEFVVYAAVTLQSAQRP